MTRDVLLFSVALLAGGLGGRLFQDAPDATPVLRANRLELVSPSGQVRGVFEASEDGATIQLTRPDAPGTLLSISASGSAGGSIALSDHSGDERLALDGDLYGKPAISSFGPLSETTLWMDHRLMFQVLPKKGAIWSKNLGMSVKQAQGIEKSH